MGSRLDCRAQSNGRYTRPDELTSWGEAGVPKYHTQFIAISGLVEFRSTDPRKLPTTTTKREIECLAAFI